MYKSIICAYKENVCTILENMENLGYDVKKSVISIIFRDSCRDSYVIFYRYDESLGEPLIW